MSHNLVKRLCEAEYVDYVLVLTEPEQLDIIPENDQNQVILIEDILINTPKTTKWFSKWTRCHDKLYAPVLKEN